MQLIPLGDRLLVERAKEEVMVSGIHLPSNAQEKPQEGKVLALGAEVDPLAIQPGDIALFGKYAGLDIEVEGKNYLLLRFDEAVAIKREAQDSPQTA
jgi:chaperonin GroES